mmetsp:Transcript_10140/g.23929  ORF Transcript_10140/g.23929 Transcript_10140/m.23929 type:complete len:397 (-) Transcript_10140:182-1372(-)
MEGAGRNEQDVVRVDIAVFGADGRPLHQGEKIALHTLGAGIGALGHGILGRADLVDLVHEDDAGLLHGGDGLLLQIDRLQQALQLNVEDDVARLGYGQRLALGGDAALAARPAAGGQLGYHLVHGGDVGIALAAEDDLPPGSAGLVPLRHGNVDVDGLIIELSSLEHVAEGFPRRAGDAAASTGVGSSRRRGSRQQVQDSLLDQALGLLPQLLRLLLLGEGHADVHQIADDLVDVPAVVAHLGELGRLDLDEGRLAQRGHPPGHLGLAASRRADHEDVPRRHLLHQVLGQLPAAPPVPHGDRHGALGVGLADDVRIEVVHHLQGSEAVLQIGLGGVLCGRGRIFGRRGRHYFRHYFRHIRLVGLGFRWSLIAAVILTTIVGKRRKVPWSPGRCSYG